MRIAIGPSSFAAADSAPLEMLEHAGCEVIPNPYGRRLSEEEIIAHLCDVDGLIAGLEPLSRRVLASADRLKALARVGIGMANVDREAAKELGIQVSNTPEGPTEAVAEMALAALLALTRRLVAADRAMHERRWEKTIGRGVRGLKVLIVGYGRIGRRFADLIRPMGAEILVCDPAVDPASLVEGEGCMGLAEALVAADVISLHASGEQTILGPAELAALSSGTLLLNSARGSLVDEAALIEALDAGRIGGAWLDAFWEEPYDGPLVGRPDVLLTPHMSTYTRQCRRSMEVGAVENLLRALNPV